MIRTRAKTAEELAHKAEAIALKTAVTAFDAPDIRPGDDKTVNRPDGRLLRWENEGGAMEGEPAPPRTP